jgi:hypothetical protein
MTTRAVRIVDDICDIADHLNMAKEIAARLSSSFEPPEHPWNGMWAEVHTVIKVSKQLADEAAEHFMQAADAVLRDNGFSADPTPE